MTRLRLALAGLLVSPACSTGKSSDTTGFTSAASASATDGSGSSGSSGSSSGSGTAAGTSDGSGSGSSGTTGGVGSSTGGSGSSGGMGSTSGVGSSGSGGSTGGELMCSDANEPNDSESNAKPLGIIDDCDGSGSSVSGQLAGASDVDWLAYSASDVFGCVVDPSRDVVSAGNIRFCKFINCASGTADISGCPGGAFPSTSPAGHPGCCKVGANLSNFDVPVDCSGTDDSAQVLMRLDQGPAGVCTAYTVDYNF